MGSPSLPHDRMIAKFDGGQGEMWIWYRVEEPEEWLGEDDWNDLTETVDEYIYESMKLVDKEDFDVYENLQNKLRLLDTGIWFE